ncbi:MAG: DUF4113 domain-containing protein [Hyphomicrobiales bacterium]|nr:MAG: DUF4113 domain-containing protein [Hyphomicrobiales bacterium]
MTRFFEVGYPIQQAGVILLDLGSSSIYQRELDSSDSESPDRSGLMAPIDKLNRRYESGTVSVGGAERGAREAWCPKQRCLTPQRTTRLEDIPVARA